MTHLLMNEFAVLGAIIRTCLLELPTDLKFSVVLSLKVMHPLLKLRIAAIPYVLNSSNG